MILADLSDSALGKASKQNLLAFFLFLRRAPSVEFLERDGLSRWMTRVPDHWFNGIYISRPPRPGDEAFLDEAASHFAHHGMPGYVCWIDVEVERASWHDLLIERGFEYTTGEAGMAMTLDALPQSSAPPEGLTMRRVTSAAQLDVWCQLFVDGYDLPAESTRPLTELIGGLGIDFPLIHYLGERNGTPVATSSLFFAAGVAGVGNVSTLPSVRRQGVGAYATLYPLYEARDLGYLAAILQASELGFPVYERLGFRKLCDVDNYFRTLDPATGGSPSRPVAG